MSVNPRMLARRFMSGPAGCVAGDRGTAVDSAPLGALAGQRQLGDAGWVRLAHGSFDQYAIGQPGSTGRCREAVASAPCRSVTRECPDVVVRRRRGRVSIELGEITLLLLQCLHQARATLSTSALGDLVGVSRVGDGRQNSDHGNRDHELNQREPGGAPLQSVHGLGTIHSKSVCVMLLHGIAIYCRSSRQLILPAGMEMDCTVLLETKAFPASVILVLEFRTFCSMVTVRLPVGVRAV